MKNVVFFYITPCCACKNRCFGGYSASIIRVTRIGELGTTLAVSSKYFFAGWSKNILCEIFNIIC
jgi:hypothetical protein